MEEDRRKHISGKSLLIPFGAALIICGGFSVAVSMRMHYGYEKVEQTNKEVLTINELSDQFNEGSDILTDNLRLYVSTGAQKYIKQLTKFKKLQALKMLLNHILIERWLIQLN